MGYMQPYDINVRRKDHSGWKYKELLTKQDLLEAHGLELPMFVAGQQSMQQKNNQQGEC